MLEFDVKVRVSKYDELEEDKDPAFRYGQSVEDDVKEHLKSSIVQSPFIIHADDEVLIYNIVDITKVEDV